MKELLDINSSKYIRRLVRRLNEEAMTGNGFYPPVNSFGAGWGRCGEARFSRGTLYVRPIGDSKWGAISMRDGFTDNYGRNIVASRKP